MNFLFINTKGNWGGIVNLYASLMQALACHGHTSWYVNSPKRIRRFQLPPPVHNVPLSFGFDYNPLSILKLILLIRKHHIDCVVVNIAKELIFGGIAAKFTGIKCIRLVGNELDFESHPLISTYLVHLNIFPSQYTLSVAHNRFPYTRQLYSRVVYCGTEDRLITPNQRLDEYKRINAQETNLIIGCTGRIVEDKGVHILVKAFAQVHNSIPKAILVINGTGAYLPELDKLAKTLGIEAKVRLLGFAPDCLVAASIYDIAVMPSRFEGFPNTLIEYLSLGKAVITTLVGGIAEAISDGSNGLVFPVDDADALAAKILSLANDRSLALKLGDQARIDYLNRFTSTAMVSTFLSYASEL